MEENRYISEEQLVKLKEWAKSEEGKKEISKICNDAYDNAKYIRDFNKAYTI